MSTGVALITVPLNARRAGIETPSVTEAHADPRLEALCGRCFDDIPR